jgi:hypothetical protein
VGDQVIYPSSEQGFRSGSFAPQVHQTARLGFEPKPREITIELQSGPNSAHPGPGDVSEAASQCVIVRDVVTESSDAYEL